MVWQSLLVWGLIGLAAGWLASRVLGGKGIVRYIVVGMTGSVVGSYLFAALGISLPIENYWISTVATAAAGAAVVIVVARLIAK